MPEKETLPISCMIQSLIEEEDAEEIEGMLNAMSSINQITPEDMAKEQRKDHILEVVCPYVTAREKLKSLAITKLN